tara:strand:- start:1489 stop:2604 length:1116 start_codon:yes stop_codon:yes gene_type:complete
MRNLTIIFSSLIFTFFTCDYFYSQKKKNFNANVFSKNCIKNSIKLGYEYFPNQKCRYKRVVKNHLEYDNVFFTNNFGFVSGFDYQIQNKDKVKRAVVLGYSKTEGNYLKTNWPTKASNDSEGKFEFYNFARAGYFNLNLYNIYFDLVRNFSFDYIFLPIVGKTDDQFMIFEKRKDGIYDGLFKNQPRSEEDFNSNFFSKMSLMYTFFNSYDSSSLSSNFDIFTRNYIIFKKNFNKLLGKNTSLRSLDDHQSNLFPGQEHHKFYKFLGKRNVEIFLAIISDALNKGAKVVFYQGLIKGKLPSKSRKDSTYHFYKWLKKKYPNKFLYFDGNETSINISKSDYKDLFFKYDGHWNQKGSDLFARGILNFLKQNK